MAKLGKYEIIKELGRGGFGIVYEAKDTVLLRPAAVKVLHTQLTVDPTFLSRFEQEARLAAQLEHPNLVQVYDFGQENGRNFIAMGLMRGGSLKDQIKALGVMDPVQSKKVLAEILGGLCYIHENDVIHRDLKPSNILFDQHGTARISDLGFAKALQQDVSTSLSVSGGLIGTPAYMAPELWRGKPATPQSDIYSLGCIFYEMLSGKVLFDGETPAESMTKHLIDGPVFEVALLDKWQDMIVRCLEREPEKRYASAGPMLEDLRKSDLDESITPKPDLPVEITEEPAKDAALPLQSSDSDRLVDMSPGNAWHGTEDAFDDANKDALFETTSDPVPSNLPGSENVITPEKGSQLSESTQGGMRGSSDLQWDSALGDNPNKTTTKTSPITGKKVLNVMLAFVAGLIVISLVLTAVLLNNKSKTQQTPVRSVTDTTVTIQKNGQVTTEEPAKPEEPARTEESVEEVPAEEEPAEEETPDVVVYEPEPYGENLPTAPTINKPLVVAYSGFSEKFSPFFSETANDTDVAGMTQVSLLTTDRLGQIVMNAIEGETRSYNNVDYLYKGAANLAVHYDKDTDLTTYAARLRVGMKFSDGEPVTADDVIFTYYTYLDPSYVGPTNLYAYPIVGLQEYLTQTPSAVLERYQQYAKDIFEAGRDHKYSESDAWTKELQEGFWAEVDKFGLARTQEIVDYVVNNYLDRYAEDKLSKSPDEVRGSQGLQVALGMALWGFGDMENGVFRTSTTGKTFDLVTKFPTVKDYYADILAAYENDVVKAWEFERAGDITDVKGIATTAFIKIWGPKDAETGGEGVPNIAGIKKIDDYNIEITLKGFSAPAVYSVLGVSITPLHYYGDKAKYDYENNKFGFDYGDLTKQQSLTAKPMGAGAYKFVEYDNRIVRFEANEHFYKGCPRVKEIQFKETDANEVASAIKTGDADAGELPGSRTRFEEVQGYNSNYKLIGDVITLNKVDNLGYGYVGINADTVNVGGKPGSDASKALRKAIATIFAIHRDVTFKTYYGEAASVINYPISNTSWAAPQPTDADYQIAFSVDVEGRPIYSAGMTLEEKVEAAKAAALGFFKKAGYTIGNGKITAVPAGAKDTYEVIIPGQGRGEHPAFAMLYDAQTDLKSLGFNLIINDPKDANALWGALDNGSQEMWTAAWGATIDPDMYHIYHSSNIVGKGGTDSNHYHIRDAQLDQYILDALKSEDQNYRKAIYKQALDTIIDWAVEIPTYQRQNAVLFSSKRVNIETITPDITTFWGWMNDIQLIEMIP